MTRFTRLSASDRRQMLIQTACLCMEDDGIAGFTIDRICTRAQVSRGLIAHHFGNIGGLMAATYAQLYEEDLPATQGLAALLDTTFDPARFNRPRLNLWLALWQAIANTPELTAEHRRRYGAHVARVAEALRTAGAPAALSPLLIALIDGLALQHCIDPESMPPERARAACAAFLTLQT
ncbi:TetR family transcriptional regulator C-terminal domain-containing protein [Rhodobacter sp. KR11]|uniref:TetR/AcrR family transcriptional regulator n=1 Tax=Rhodobacter sp. KR11 TaxID=2974588 RepID=UPI0022213A06|nr:TetR family transcriptional regulator C-terminal domain-containing protein [Rhodobacter sp. KR11]MCW1920689.1 TetR family transcriptional regulator C-terminal domain-containing protein [Rhodobacter sp. KR11]